MNLKSVEWKILHLQFLGVKEITWFELQTVMTDFLHQLLCSAGLSQQNFYQSDFSLSHIPRVCTLYTIGNLARKNHDSLDVWGRRAGNTHENKACAP
jgi:hypothetical protein